MSNFLRLDTGDDNRLSKEEFTSEAKRAQIEKGTSLSWMLDILLFSDGILYGMPASQQPEAWPASFYGHFRDVSLNLPGMISNINFKNKF